MAFFLLSGWIPAQTPGFGAPQAAAAREGEALLERVSCSSTSWATCPCPPKPPPPCSRSSPSATSRPLLSIDVDYLAHPRPVIVQAGSPGSPLARMPGR